MADRPALELEPAAAFESLRSSFERASTAVPDGLSRSSFTLAGETVRVRVAGRRLAGALARPLAHLSTPVARAERPGLTIDLWDVEESGVRSMLGAINGTGTEGAVTSSPDGRFLAQAGPSSLLALDRTDRRLVGCLESGSRLSLVDRARPLVHPLTVWGADRGVHVIHAGLVARSAQGVLLAGSAEAGKSTAALACAGAGFDFLADDCLALTEPAEGEFEGHSLYASATLDPDHLAGFPPRLASAADGVAPGNGKALVFPGEAPRLNVTRVVPISALALPRIVGSADSRPLPAPKGEALRRLAPGTLAKRAVPARACMSRLARLVERVPCFWLDLDSDLGAIPRRVERLMAEAGLE